MFGPISIAETLPRDHFSFDLNVLLKSKNVFLWNEKRLIETLDKGDPAIDFRRGIESLIPRRPRIVSS